MTSIAGRGELICPSQDAIGVLNTEIEPDNFFRTDSQSLCIIRCTGYSASTSLKVVQVLEYSELAPDVYLFSAQVCEAKYGWDMV